MKHCLLSFALAMTCGAETVPLQMIVMDPLALQLSCTCVKGTGQRRYDLLARHIEEVTGRTVKVTFDESLSLAMKRTEGHADLIIGKDGMVRLDAENSSLSIRPLASLTDTRGSTHLNGVFLVRSSSPLKKLEDLDGGTICLGPVEDEESHAAAKSALKHLKALKWRSEGSMDSAALALSDGKCDAAVVSAFLPVLLEGCGKLDKGSTRIIGETGSVPFIRVFATASVNVELQESILRALNSVAASAELLAALESKAGLVLEQSDVWPDWRGAGRKGTVTQLPASLPSPLPLAWSAPLTGPPMAGVAVDSKFVVAPDKTADGKRDIFRCLSAQNGHEVWHLDYDAPDDLEYTNAPRATPVIHDGLVYLQGALGHLHCVELTTGKVIWKRHIFTDFKAARLNWGAAIAPLVVDEKLIIAPGSKSASVVALDRKTGDVIWQTPGHAAGYSAFIIGTFSGVRQIIGYDAASCGGWDPITGKRLWELVPPNGSDFNVTTPVMIGDQLLLATENNGTRLFRFDGQGRIVSKPVTKNDALAPDTCTPAIAGQRVFATAYGELYCLDLANGLKTLWHQKDDMFHDHCNIIASDKRLLVWTASGELLMLDAAANNFQPLAKLRPFTDKHPDSLAHPAIAGGRIYLRTAKELACFDFK